MKSLPPSVLDAARVPPIDPLDAVDGLHFGDPLKLAWLLILLSGGGIVGIMRTLRRRDDGGDSLAPRLDALAAA